MRHPVLGGSEIRNGVGISAPKKNRKRSVRRGEGTVGGKSLEDHVRDWVEKKVVAGVPERECSLPFLINAPKMVISLFLGFFLFCISLGDVESLIWD